MKRYNIIIKIMICGVLMMGLVPRVGQHEVRAQVSVSFQVFYDQLSPYGSWVNYPDYGYVWVPGAGSGFRPYGSRGHWVYTEDGWTWVSDYRWGWATFHYGNWFYDDSYGWMWVPGYQWAPAWVTWGEYGGNYCWAPVGPRVDIGVSFGSYRPPYRYWNFCPREHIMSTNISNYYVRNNNTTIINNITVINNVNRGGGRGAYLRGPQPANVERFTHRTVRPLAIQAASRPGAASVQGGRLAIYRPNVQNGGGTPRPANVREMHNLTPVNGGRPAPRPAQGAQPQGRPGQPGQQTPRPAPQQRPMSPQQQHPVQPSPRPAPQQQPRPMPPQQQHPVQPTPRPMPQQQPRPMPQQPRPQQQQPRPVPQQPRPQPQQPRPMPQQHPQQPPRPAPRPAPRPQPQQHQNPPEPRPAEHHQ